jgi:hypothetical protein
MSAFAFSADCYQSVELLVATANSPDPATAQQSITALRNYGPAGLKALLQAYDRAPSPGLIPAIDSVAGQRGALVSRLFWYTDFDQAKAAAKAENKPILYLRLMGKLTDEYSCANSRFFRTVLYSNTDISGMLRNDFVLVWVSERPVPVVTVDYGDGRVLKRTLTGNSIHYILDSDGRVMDALPGLYGPRVFASALMSGRSLASSSKRNPQILPRYLDRTDDDLLRAWQSDMALAGSQEPIVNTVVAPAVAGKAPLAPAAMRRAISKGFVETPLLAQIDPRFVDLLNQSIDKADAATWEKVAERHIDDARLDASSIAVIRAQNPDAYKDPAALDRLVAHFQHLIALDTVHNDYQLRRQIIAWLRVTPGKISVEDLNQRVYADLFLTPKSDPWLGLAPDEYCALNGNGCTEESK